MFKLSQRSLDRLKGVHPQLVKVVKLAITQTRVDFGVAEGLRARSRQQQLFDKGATTTLNSRHITGHAVDLVAYVGPRVRWDWPLYHTINVAMTDAAITLDIPLEWGGHWKTFPDGPHYQLPWSFRDHPALEAPHKDPQ